jgi:cell division protein FtsQ
MPDRQPPKPQQASRWRLGFFLRGLATVIVAGVGALGLRHGIAAADIGRGLDDLAVHAGLGVNQISVVGFRNVLSDDIFAAIGVDKASSLLSYDTAAARARLEALAWVERAEISRVLPDGLVVAIRERAPFAVWQHHQLAFLIDADGRTLEPTAPAEHKDLPLVVGDGADAAARGLVQLLRAYPVVLSRLQAAVRVGGRRWDLKLADGITAMLPEVAPETALAWIEKQHAEERLLDRRLATIDLRAPERVAFALAPPVKQPVARLSLLVDGGR